MDAIRRGVARALDAFNDWFGSDAGTMQTLIVCLVVVAIEIADPRLDPKMLVLMAVLTIYSAVTQPALARSGRVGDVRMQSLLEKVEQLEEHILSILAVVENQEEESQAACVWDDDYEFYDTADGNTLDPDRPLPPDRTKPEGTTT